MSRYLSCLLFVFVCLSSVATCQEPVSDQYPDTFRELLEVGRFVDIREIKESNAIHVHLFHRPCYATSKIVATKTDYFVTEGAIDNLRSQSARPQASRKQMVPYKSVQVVREYLFDYLDMSITSDLKREPLQSFLESMSSEIGMEIRIDAEAFKAKGYTRNMTQDVTVDNVPARQVLADLIKKYPGLTLTVHDHHYLLTSTEMAKEKQMEVVELQ